jgi:hypothetical protein
MTQANLPTDAELKILFKQKGREALVWYAWRNAMRALPSLGVIPIKNTWSKKPIYRVFTVLRANVFAFAYGIPLLRVGVSASGAAASGAADAADAAAASAAAARRRSSSD